MSEVVDSVITAGSMLRSARESRGVEITALATTLKVPASKLEALEADNYAILSDAVFIRALAASVCRSLKIETESVLALLPQNTGPKLILDHQGLNASIKVRSVGSSFVPFAYFTAVGAVSKSLILTVILLLVATTIYFFPRERIHETGHSSAVELDVVSDAVSTSEFTSSSAVVADDSQGSVNSLPLLKTPILEISENLTPAPIVNFMSTNVANSSSNTARSDLAEAVTLRATSESWVQIRDAAGATVLQKNLMAGENITVSALPPLAFIIGRADVTEVLVRGKTFDMSGVTRDNVARFEVK